MSHKLTTKIPHKNIIVNLFLKKGWHKIPLKRKEIRTQILPYLEESFQFNVLGKQERVYRLNDYGRTVAKLIMQEYGWTPKRGSGICIEYKYWDHIKSHKFSVEKLSEAFEEIARIGGVPCDIYNDWREKTTRVIIRDLDRAIARISSKIEWEIYKEAGEQHLKNQGWNKEMIWLWIQYFGKLRKEIRQIPYQQEFILWNS